jgi:hypothetical protein
VLEWLKFMVKRMYTDEYKIPDDKGRHRKVAERSGQAGGEGG